MEYSGQLPYPIQALLCKGSASASKRLSCQQDHVEHRSRGLLGEILKEGNSPTETRDGPGTFEAE